MRLLDFDVLEKKEVPDLVWENDDVELLKWARRHKRILLGMDLYRRTTGVLMTEEIRARNGRVLTIAGGPQQPIHRALGKLLFFQERWEPFFVEGHGRVNVRSIGSSPNDQVAKLDMTRPQDLPILGSRTVAQGEAYLKQRSARRVQPSAGRRRPQTTSLEQTSLQELIDSDADTG